MRAVLVIWLLLAGSVTCGTASLALLVGGQEIKQRAWGVTHALACITLAVGASTHQTEETYGTD